MIRLKLDHLVPNIEFTNDEWEDDVHYETRYDHNGLEVEAWDVNPRAVQVFDATPEHACIEWCKEVNLKVTFEVWDRFNPEEWAHDTWVEAVFATEADMLQFKLVWGEDERV